VTDFLQINGITVPVSLNSADLEQEDLGEMHRAEDGTPIFNRRATKRRWSGKTTVLPAQTALALRDLVTGKGHNLSWENNNHYTSKGLAPAVIGANFTISAVNPKFGTKRAASSSGANNRGQWFMFTPNSPWSVALYVTGDGGASWTHYMINSAGQKWRGGSRNDAVATTFIDVNTAAGLLTLGEAGVAWGFDDFVGLPFVAPVEWPPQMAAFGQAFPDLPSMLASGLWIEQNASIPVIGAPGKLQAYVGTITTRQKNLQDFSFSLLEK
jgi:hypothetical protein